MRRSTPQAQIWAQDAQHAALLKCHFVCIHGHNTMLPNAAAPGLEYPIYSVADQVPVCMPVCFQSSAPYRLSDGNALCITLENMPG